MVVGANSPQNVQKHNNAIQETTKSIHAQTVKLVEEQTESVGVQLWELEEFVNRARAQNQRIHTDSKESITRLFDGGCESIEQFASLIKGFHDEVGSFEEVVTMATIGLEKFDEFGTNTRQRLSQLRTKVESEPLKECLPTGQTPRKRKFTFPATLPSTGAADDVVARARGTFYSKRPALGEKEVNSPKKLTPNATTLVADDVAKSGGAGIGATFYPTVSGKKKVLREALGTENDGGVKAGEADGNVFLSGDGTANRRQSLRKRKVGEAGEGTEELASISTTRRRLR